MTFIILDLDNTIANDEWRIKAIDWDCESMFDRYHNYHLLSAFDRPGNLCLFKNSKHDIVIFTARPIHYQAATVEWLVRNGVKVKHLFMRGNDDHQHSVALKEGQLKRLIAFHGIAKNSIACAYDDRPDVIEMYRRNGVAAEQVSIHSNCSYIKPKEKIA